MRSLLIIFTISFCLSPFTGKAQTAKYLIEVAGLDIGTQTVKESRKGDTVKVEVNSKVKISMIFTYRVTYTQYSIYIGGKLHAAEVVIIKNGEVEKTTKTQWKNGHYEITTNGKRKKIAGAITYSGSNFYFHEPAGISQSYNEADGVMLNIKKIGAGLYETTNPEDGRTNEFVYKNGVLQKSEIDNPLLNFTSTLIE